MSLRVLSSAMLLSILVLGGCTPPGGVDDDDSASASVLCWADDDADGFGDALATPVPCEDLPGGVLDSSDCDDSDASVHPGAPELCDGVDNDCDGTLPADEIDADGDGQTPCGGDCDDSDPSTYPGAPELCDGADNDCDGAVPADEVDADADGQAACDDCDDSDPSTYPGAPELCDGVDNDCDGTLPADELDDDGDGQAACDGDCDDSDPTTYLGASELCDGVDNDCNGQLNTVEQDLDGDGELACAFDCDDGDPTVGPGFPELCDGADNDCDGTLPADEVDGDGDGALACADCDDTDGAVFPGAPAGVCDGVDTDCDGALEPIDVTDGDGDGFTACDDCDDLSATVFPAAPWACDGVDTDCDGAPDGDEVDDDGDGATECGGDCDDTDPGASPGAAEACDGVDNDCDGVVPADETSDADGDGVVACADCDDLDPALLNPTVETCDGIDNDCDGSLTGEQDLDGDGLLDCALFEWLAGWAGLTWDEATNGVLPQEWWDAASDCGAYSGSGTPAITQPYGVSPWPFSHGNATRSWAGPCTSSTGAALTGTVTGTDTSNGGPCPSMNTNWGPSGLPYPLGIWSSEFATSGAGVAPASGPALSWAGTVAEDSSCGATTESETVITTSTTVSLDVDATWHPIQPMPWLLGDGEHTVDMTRTSVSGVDGWVTLSNGVQGTDLAVTTAGVVARTGGPSGSWTADTYTGSYPCLGSPILCWEPAFCADEPMTGSASIAVRDSAGAVLQTQSVVFDGQVNCTPTVEWSVDGVVVGVLTLPAPF